MTQHPQNPHKANRKRFLNVIYFVDSNKTKTFKFSLRASYVAISLLVIMLFWSMFSTALLVSNYNRAAVRSQRIRNLLATIFNYQTRYDKVYEKTYPMKLHANDAATVTAVNKDSEKADPESKPEATISLAAKPAPQAVATATAGKTESTPDPPKRAKPQVKVEKFKVNTKPDGLSLKFAVKNLDRPNKANGYVIGFAKFLGLNGTTRLVTSPSDIKEGEPINKWALPRGHRFSIRYYTQKTLDFDLPDKNGGSFESIKIIVGSKNNEPLEFVYNINGTEGTFAPIIPDKKTDDTHEEPNSEQQDIQEESEPL